MAKNVPRAVSAVAFFSLATALDASGRADNSFGAGAGWAARARFDKRAALLCCSLLDLGASALLLAALRRAAQQSSSDSAHAAAAADSDGVPAGGGARWPTIACSCLPPRCADAAQAAQLGRDVANYFEHSVLPPPRPGGKRPAARVLAVSLVRDLGALLRARLKLNAMLSALAQAGLAAEPPSSGACFAEVAAMLCAAGPVAAREAVAAQTATVARLEATATAADVAAAFVTFSRPEHARCAAARLPPGLARRLSARLRAAAAPRFKRSFTLRCSAAPDPNGIVWENLADSAPQLFLRRAAAALFLAALLIGATGVSVGAKRAARAAPQPVDCAAAARAGALDCAALWPLSSAAGANASSAARDAVDALRGGATDGGACALDAHTGQFTLRMGAAAPDALQMACAAATCYGCFCSSAETGGKALLGSGSSTTDAFCKDWSNSYTRGWALRGGAAVAAIVANAALAGLVPALTRFERHASAARAAAREAQSLFVASFSASLIAPLAAYSSIAPLRRLRLAFDGSYPVRRGLRGAPAAAADSQRFERILPRQRGTRTWGLR
jgi:hypothetical protein